MNSPSSSELSSDLDLTSVGSLSPPPYYPSPPPSQEDSSGKDAHLSHKRSREEEDAPVLKKRRKVEPKPRTTQYLNLRPPLVSTATDQSAQLDLLVKTIRKRQKIVVIAGAGISVSAGIPDFRSSTGLFAALRAEHKLKSSGKHLFDASVYQTDDSTSSFHDMVRELSEKTATAKPTEFHHLIARLAGEGRLMRLYTQNVDGLDTGLPPLGTTCPLSSKGPWPRTVQLHGGLQKMTCSKCNHISDFEPALFRGSTPPPCTVCIEADKVRTDHAGKRSHGVGKLRPRMVLYNEFNPDDEAIGTVMKADLRARPDAVIVVGTSMKIPGVKRIVREMCGVVRGRRDGVAIWINHEPPPVGKEFENCWDLVVEGDSDKVASHASMKRWDDNSLDYMECSESDSERAKANDSNVKVIIDPPVQKKVEHSGSAVQVVVESPAKKAVGSALLTPAASPRSKSIEPAIQVKIFPHLKILGTKESEKVPKPLKPKKSFVKASVGKDKITKPAISKSSKSGNSTAAKQSNIKINTAFKISKSQPLSNFSNLPAKRNAKEVVILSEEEDQAALRPMAPISPSAARNNGPLLPPLQQMQGLANKDSFSSPPPQENAPPQMPIEKAEVFERGKSQTLNDGDIAPRSPTLDISPHFITTRNSPSRPPFERLVSPAFIETQNSPSRPPYEKFILPGDPQYPNINQIYHHLPKESSAQADANEAKSPVRLLFPITGAHARRQSDRPPCTGLVIDTTAKPARLETGRLKRMSEEIVSPTTIPENMRSLLN